MLSVLVETEVRKHAQNMALSHPAVTQANAGKVAASNVLDYLASLRFLLSRTVPHLRRAKARATDMGLTRLVPYLDQKIAEETGHERWAEDDVRELARHLGSSLAGRPLPAVVELVAFLDELTETDPRLYVVYALCNEYFTVLAGPAWIRGLSENCGVPLQALTAANKHIDADRAHAVHGFSELDELITDAALVPAVEGTIDRTMHLFDRFFREVVGHAESKAPTG